MPEWRTWRSPGWQVPRLRFPTSLSSMGTLAGSHGDLLVLEEKRSRVLVYGSTFKTCAVCIEEYADGDLLHVLDACGHCFHAKCVDEWLLNAPFCPVCKASAPAPSQAVTVRSSQPDICVQQQPNRQLAVQLIDLSVHESWVEWFRGLLNVHRTGTSEAPS